MTPFKIYIRRCRWMKEIYCPCTPSLTCRNSESQTNNCSVYLPSFFKNRATRKTQKCSSLLYCLSFQPIICNDFLKRKTFCCIVSFTFFIIWKGMPVFRHFRANREQMMDGWCGTLFSWISLNPSMMVKEWGGNSGKHTVTHPASH